MEDYDFTLQYHPDKANIVADTLNRKSSSILACLALENWNQDTTVSNYDLQYSEGFGQLMIYNIASVPKFIQQVKHYQW